MLGIVITLQPAPELFPKWEEHWKARIETVIERTKMGSTMRKETGSEVVQAEEKDSSKQS
jgi:hypothetical protein